MKLNEYQSNPAAFRDALLIDTDTGPRPFKECANDWQREDFAALDTGWMRAAGQNVEDGYSRAWLERPRGHSKSQDIAMMATWALFASKRRLSGIAAAGDLDQARLLRDAMSKLVYVNPWLSKVLEVHNYRVRNKHTESTLDIISSDAPSAYGLTCDFVICDEVVHWQKQDLWDSLFSTAAKRSRCMLVIITNAGLTDDWQWKIREAVRTDPRWYFHRLDGPVASWINSDVLAEQERLLPGIAYRRLWLNEWTSGGGDALTPEDIAAAFRADLAPHDKPHPDYTYVAGLDLGVSRDASAVCVLGVHRGAGDSHGRIRLAHTKLWKPVKGSRVNLQSVEDTLVQLHQLFNFKRVNFDPWEARHMASRLQADGLGTIDGGIYRKRKASLPMVEVTQTSKNLQAQATAVIEAFNDHRLELFEDPDLRRDVTRFRVEERASGMGFRLVSPRDQHGHGDMGTAFQLALLAASEMASLKVFRAGTIGGSSSESQIMRSRQAWGIMADYCQRTGGPIPFDPFE